VQPALIVDAEFQNKIPPLTEDEYKQLEQNIIDAGEVYEPIITWNGTIVDGHNRYKIIQTHPGLIWKTKEINFPDKWAAFDWMYKNQLGRRNLTEEQRTYLLGKLYEARKHAVSNEEGRNQYSKEVSPQIGNQPNRVSEQIAKEQNIGKNTVLRAEKFSQGVDAIREVSSETADSILRGETKVTKQDVSMVAKAEPEERKRMVQQIEKGEKITPVAVPDKIVNKPENKYTGGGTAEYRAQRDKIAAVVADMYDPTTVPEYDLTALLNEISWSAEVYIKTLRNQIKDHLELAKENRETIEGILNEIKDDIESIKEEMDK